MGKEETSFYLDLRVCEANYEQKPVLYHNCTTLKAGVDALSDHEDPEPSPRNFKPALSLDARRLKHKVTFSNALNSKSPECFPTPKARPKHLSSLRKGLGILKSLTSKFTGARLSKREKSALANNEAKPLAKVEKREQESTKSPDLRLFHLYLAVYLKFLRLIFDGDAEERLSHFKMVGLTRTFLLHFFGKDLVAPIKLQVFKALSLWLFQSPGTAASKNLNFE